MKRGSMITTSKSSPSTNSTYPTGLIKNQKENKLTFKDRKIKPRMIIRNTEKAGNINQKPYLILEDRLNFTPNPLNDSLYPSVSEKLKTSVLAWKTLAKHKSSLTSELMDSMSSFSLVQKRFTIRDTTTSAGLMSLTPSDFIWSFGEEEFDSLWEDRVPSMFRLREDPPPRNVPYVSSMTVNLTETGTMFHIQLPSEAASVTNNDGQIIAESNVLYEQAVETSKTKTHTATQTTRVVQKHRKQLIACNQRANASTFASVWDIYDCWLNESRKSDITSTDSEMQHIKEEQLEEDNITDVIEYEGHTLSSRVLDSFMVLERLIQRDYSEKQLLYRGLMLQDPLSVNVTCKYTLSLLWTFNGEHTRARKVTSISWCSKDGNILAVGYGKLNYTDKCGGLVCIWNVKQPNNPERCFVFDDPVTFVNFSEIKSQLLAVSFYSGLVLLVDVTFRALMVKASNENYPLYHPVWQVHWFGGERHPSLLNLLTCGKNGRIYKYKKTKFFISKKIKTIQRPHGNIQGVDLPRKCHPRSTLTCQNPSALVLVHHPDNPLLYLVGTSEGCVYTCSVNNYHDHIDVFVAHDGPVYAIQFNPFCGKVFLTCGADWCIRIWAETIHEPLITLESGMTAVYNAVWNPLNSTIIVSTSGSFINVWDIRRNIVSPKSTTESPTGSINSVLQFTENKYNICVGDDEGNVHIMALTEMPFSPTFQEDVLVKSILNTLICQQALRQKLWRLGPPFAESETSSYKAKMYRRLNYLHRFI